MSGQTNGGSMTEPAGMTGARGPIGGIVRWTECRDITFDIGTGNIWASDLNIASEIATYLASGSSPRFRIDGTMDQLYSDLSVQRINAVRTALMRAGVPNAAIQGGVVNDLQFTHNGRVEILLSTR